MAIVRTLEKLISFKTITGDVREALRALSWVEEQIRPASLHTKWHTYDGYPALVATTRRTKKPKLWLAGHIDVVPGGAHLFRARTGNGRMFGRGVCDMKFAIACYIELLRELGSRAREFDLGLMLTSDEEEGGFSGTKKLLDKAGYRGDIVFLPDGGGPWQFEELAKGKMVSRAYTEGISAHGSRPWLGRNAILELSAALAELYAWAEARGRGKPDKWYTTVVPTTLTGGDATNTIPEYAEAWLDIRPTGASEVVAVERMFAKLVKRYPNTRFETEHAEPCCGITRSNEYARAFARISAARHGIACGWTRAHGASDARHFAPYGVPCLLVVPHSGASHSEEEWVDIEDLKRYYDVMREWVREVARRD